MWMCNLEKKFIKKFDNAKHTELQNIQNYYKRKVIYSTLINPMNYIQLMKCITTI